MKRKRDVKRTIKKQKYESIAENFIVERKLAVKPDSPYRRSVASFLEAVKMFYERGGGALDFKSILPTPTKGWNLKTDRMACRFNLTIKEKK